MSLKKQVVLTSLQVARFHKWPVKSFHKFKKCELNSRIRYMCGTHSYPCELNTLKSKFPDVEIPNVPLTDFIWEKLDKWPDKTAMVCGVTGQSYTYSQLRSKSLKFAVSLQRMGLQKGDVLAIVLPNMPNYPIAFLGAIEAGLVVTTVNPLYTSSEISKQLSDCNAKCIVTITDLHSTVLEATKSLEKPPHILITMSKDIPRGTVKFEEMVDDSVNITELYRHQVDPDDITVLPYSSGTTGLPKGVMLTHRNIIANCLQITTEPSMLLTHPAHGNHQDRVHLVLPMFHIYGMVVIMLSRFCDGCKMVSMPKFEPKTFINSMVEHKINISFLVPPLVMFLTNHPSITKEHLRYLNLVMSGAAPLGKTDAEKFLQKAGGNIKFIQGYGLTESSPSLLLCPIDNKNLAAAGMLLPSTKCRVQDVETGETLGAGKIGELLFKGPQVMKGYLNNPVATEQTITKSGWLKTGDLGYYDDEGYFYVKDRLKELIKVKGFQVAPAELEALLRSHPSVSEAAVIGIPDERSGEVPKAFVVPKSPGSVSEKELQMFVASKVSEFKQLAGGVQFLDSLPKSPSGKLLRRIVKEQYVK